MSFSRLTIFAAAIALAAAPAFAGETLDRVMSTKTLTMSSDPEYPPQSFLNDKNEMDGFDVDVGKEVAKRKITVNCVSPGFIETELIADLPEELAKEYKKSVPAKRFGTPEEVAHAVMFLTSREAAYVTGTTLEVAGGL